MVFTKTMNAGMSESINIKVVKKQYTAPEILESFIDDNGDLQHILANGNIQSEISYAAFWNKKKSEIKPKGFKGVAATNYSYVK